MQTNTLSQADMAGRVARYSALTPLPTQSGGGIPQEARDIIYARKIYSVIGLENATTPINMGAPIKGAGGMTMAIAVCPPGQGPELHNHRQTFETFTVLRGRFEVRWNDDGRETLTLGEFDTISVPPGVCRAFRNVGEEEGVLQVIISGGVHDMKDIDFAKPIAGRLEAISPQALTYFKDVGFTFTACKDG